MAIGSLPIGKSAIGKARQGTSTSPSVYADSATSYIVRNAVSAPVATAFALRGAVSVDSPAGYSIRASAAQDITGVYGIRGPALADNTVTYGIRGSAQRDVVGLYAIRGAALADCTTSYSVLSAAAVGAGNSSIYTVLGRALGDDECAYAVRGPISADLAGAYAVLTLASRDVLAVYQVVASVAPVLSDNSVAYAIDGEPAACPTVEQIAAAVLSAMSVSPPPVDVHRMNTHPVIGDGSEASPWRGEGVSP